MDARQFDQAIEQGVVMQNILAYAVATRMQALATLRPGINRSWFTLTTIDAIPSRFSICAILVLGHNGDFVLVDLKMGLRVGLRTSLRALICPIMPHLAALPRIWRVPWRMLRQVGIERNCIWYKSVDRLSIISTFFVVATAACAQIPIDAEAPRIVAALEQGRRAELGQGMPANPTLAALLYCDAGSMGSAEGHFLLGRLLARGPVYLRNLPQANAYLALAARLGHHAAIDELDELGERDEKNASATLDEECGGFAAAPPRQSFDLDSYLATFPLSKRHIAASIRRLAPRYGIDVRIALAVALVESNLDSQAVSAKNAQGVMQLIPATQERFGVRHPFDPEANVKGGLAYLKWLNARFKGNWTYIIAAYNAGEGRIDDYGGVPPWRETRQYVRRVLYFAGID